MFFISSKKLIRSEDIQVFVFLFSPSFSPVSHCFRGWSKKNHKVYDVITSVNKNVATILLDIIEKRKSCEIETSIDKELNKEHFYGKVTHILCTKS